MAHIDKLIAASGIEAWSEEESFADEDYGCEIEQKTFTNAHRPQQKAQESDSESDKPAYLNVCQDAGIDKPKPQNTKAFFQSMPRKPQSVITKSATGGLTMKGILVKESKIPSSSSLTTPAKRSGIASACCEESKGPSGAAASTAIVTPQKRVSWDEAIPEDKDTAKDCLVDE